MCLKPFITTVDDVACSCEESFILLESMREGIIRVCPSELPESHYDLVGMVCAWDAFVEEGSAIDTSLIQHLLLECTTAVFAFPSFQVQNKTETTVLFRDHGEGTLSHLQAQTHTTK